MFPMPIIVANFGNDDNRCQRPNPAPGACYTGSATDTNLEKLTDRNYTRRRSRIVDQRVEWLDAEGYTATSKGVRL